MDLKDRLYLFRQSPETIAAIRISLAEKIADAQKEMYLRYISPDNIYAYSHGESWSNPASGDSSPSKMNTISAELIFPFERLKNGDLSIIRESVDSMSNQMGEQFIHSMFQTVNEVCEKSGQLVDGKNISAAEAIMLAFEKIEFSVNRNGEVEMPSLYTANPESMHAALMQQGTEFHERFESLKQAKTEEALDREKNRKAKFKKASQ